MKVTIKEVAKQANVAPSTVSRVLKNSPMISQATKDKVNEVISKLGYHPNEIARSLANQSTQTLGMVLPASAEDTFGNPFFTQFILGVTRYLEARNCSLLLSSAKNEAEELGQITKAVNSRRIDGMILLTIREEDQNIAFLTKKQFPFVVVGTPRSFKEILWVDNDNQKTMLQLTRHLLKTGHRNIVFLGGNQRLLVTQNRLEGYKQALKEFKIHPRPELILEVGFTEEEGYQATNQLLKRNEKIDAIMTTDDLIAYGSIRAVKDHGLSIPQDISITGFNNTVLAQYLTPSLTSVEINATELGNQAARILWENIVNRNFSLKNYIVDSQIILRESIK
ncbi:LacI family DNA-binding transcriptional regulator [Alkaliphilus crotonatoxidans]